MDNLIFSVNVVLPMAILGVLGFFLRKIGILTQGFVDVSFKLILSLILPCSMLSSIAAAPANDTFNLSLVLFAVISLTAMFGVLTLLMPRLVKDPAIAASMAHGIYRSNFIMLGVPLTARMFGDGGMAPALLIIPFSVLLNNIFCVLFFVLIIPDTQSTGTSALKSSMKKIITNPLIIASIICLIVAIFPVTIPSPILSAVDSLGKMSTPLALMALGAQFELKSIKGYMRYSIPGSLARLIAVPCIALPFAVAMGFRGPDLGALFILFAAPSAVTSYILSRSLGGNGEVAGQMVCFTTLLSAFTIVLGIFVLKTLALI